MEVIKDIPKVSSPRHHIITCAESLTYFSSIGITGITFFEKHLFKIICIVAKLGGEIKYWNIIFFI